MTCEWCETPLTGGIDTFGGVGDTFCAICYMAIHDAEAEAVREVARLRQEHTAVQWWINDLELQAMRGEDVTQELHDARQREDGLWWAIKMTYPPYPERMAI